MKYIEEFEEKHIHPRINGKMQSQLSASDAMIISFFYGQAPKLS